MGNLSQTTVIVQRGGAPGTSGYGMLDPHLSPLQVLGADFTFWTFSYLESAWPTRWYEEPWAGQLPAWIQVLPWSKC